MEKLNNYEKTAVRMAIKKSIKKYKKEFKKYNLNKEEIRFNLKRIEELKSSLTKLKL